MIYINNLLGMTPNGGKSSDNFYRIDPDTIVLKNQKQRSFQLSSANSISSPLQTLSRSLSKSPKSRDKKRLTSTSSQRSYKSIVDIGLGIVGVGVELSDNHQSQIFDEQLDITPDQQRHDIDYQFLNFDKSEQPSEHIVEILFEKLLKRRAFPSTATANLRRASIARKWALICQDQRSEIPVSTRHRDPQWFISNLKFLDVKLLHTLERSLRDKDFVENFIRLDGQMKLMTLKSSSFIEDDRGFLLISCYKSIVNSQIGLDTLVQDLKIITFLLSLLLTSKKLENRHILTNILLLMSFWAPPLGRNNILKSFSHLSSSEMFNSWLKSLDDLLEEDYLVFTSTTIKELCLSSLFLMISLCENSESYNDQKIVLYKLKEAGLYSLFYKMKLIGDLMIDEQIEKYKSLEQLTFSNELVNEINLADSQVDISFKSLKFKIGSHEDLNTSIRSILDLFCYIMEQNSQTQAVGIFKLLESMISHISKSSSPLDSTNSESIINASIQRLMDQLVTDDVARRAVQELKYFESQNDALEKNIVSLKESLEISSGSIFKRNKELQDLISSKDDEIAVLKRELQRQKDKIAGKTTVRSRDDAVLSLTNKITNRPRSSYSSINSKRNPPFESPSSNLQLFQKTVSDSQMGYYSISKTKSSLSLYSKLNTNENSANKPVNLSVTSFGHGSLNYSTSGTQDSRIKHQDCTCLIKVSSSELASRSRKNDVPKSYTVGSSSPFESNADVSCSDLPSHTFNSQVGGIVLSSGNDQPRASSPLLNSPTVEQIQPTESGVKIERSKDLEPINPSKVQPSKHLDPPPPPPPALPQFLQARKSLSTKTKLAEGTVKVTDAPPLISSPTLPSDSNASSHQSIPPPPLPPFLEKASTKPLSNNIEPSTSEEPSSSASTNHASSTAPSAPPPPPPPPPIPKFFKTSDSRTQPKEAAVDSEVSAVTPEAEDSPQISTPKTLSDPEIQVYELFEKKKIDKLSQVLQKPSKRLKQLHWDKVEKVENTFWNDPKNKEKAKELLELGILKEVEDLFTIHDKAKKKLTVSSETKAQLISFLPRDFSQQFGINLHMFASLPELELVEKILRCDDDVLKNTSVLEFFNKDDMCEITDSMLRNFKPYITDFVIGSSAEKNVNDLERADRLYLELCVNLKHYWRSRSRALLLINTYEREFHDLLGKLQRVDDSVKALQNSNNLKQLFILIREIGNFMNKKQVEGFKLSSLQKLGFIKDHNQNTFLHYVEKVIRRAYPEYLRFLQDLSILQDTAKISMDQLSQDITQFVAGIQNIVRSVESGNLSNSKSLHPLDEVLAKVKPRLPDAKRRCVLLESKHGFVLNDFENLMLHFGENPNDNVAKATFFENFLGFANNFKRAQAENLDNEEKTKLYEKRKELLLQNKKNKERQAKTPDDPLESTEDVVDNLLKRLKGVSYAKRKSAPSATISRRSTENDDDLLARAQTLLKDTKDIDV